ncbi:hypothetical protein pb186bvf_020717 [Paramecium bursaria]
MNKNISCLKTENSCNYGLIVKLLTLVEGDKYEAIKYKRQKLRQKFRNTNRSQLTRNFE